MGDNKERRESARKAFREEVTYNTLSEVGKGGDLREEGVGEEKAVCVNISDKGLCFETTRPLREKQMLKVLLPLKKVGISSPILGEVRWVNPVDGKYRVGIRFVL